MLESLFGALALVVVIGLGLSAARAGRASGTDPGTRADGAAAQGRRLPGLALAGYVLAVLFPPAGFGIGVLLANRDDREQVRHGFWMIGVSVVAAFVLFVVLIAASHGAGASGE